MHRHDGSRSETLQGAVQRHTATNTAAVDTAPPLRLALRNMDGVIDAMLQVEALAAKLRTRLRTELLSLSTTWKHQRAEVQQLMQADALVNKVPVSTLDPADYGLPPDPAHTGRGLEMRNAVLACSLARKVAKGVARLLYSSGAGYTPPTPVPPVVLGGQPAPAPAPAHTPGARRLNDAVRELRAVVGIQGHAGVRINTQAFTGVGSGLAEGAVPLLPDAPAAESPRSPPTKVLLSLRKEQRLANDAMMKSQVDSEIVAFLRGLEKRDAKRVRTAMKQETAAQSKFKQEEQVVGTPLRRALDKIEYAAAELRDSFEPVLSRAAQLANSARAAAAAIVRARVLPNSTDARMLAHIDNGAGGVATAAADAADAADDVTAVPSKAVRLSFSKSAVLRRVSLLFARAHDALVAVPAIVPGLQSQYRRARTLLLREQRRLKSANSTVAARNLVSVLQTPDFLLLTREYEEQLRLKKAARALVERVHEAVGHMARDKTGVKPWSKLDVKKWADDGSTSSSDNTNSKSRRRLLQGGVQKTTWSSSSFSIGLWVGCLAAFVMFRQQSGDL
eukprot:g2223.t1